MWPIKRPSYLLRIGRSAVQRWGSAGGVLELHDEAPVGSMDPQALQAAVISACAGGSQSDLILESCWLPVMLVPCGSSSWSRAQVEPTVRHRLSLLYAHPDAPAEAWHLEIDYWPGDSQCMAYALAPSVRAALDAAAVTARCRWRSLQPAWAWGMQRRRAREGWQVWIEQDRAIVGHFQRGRVDALNPAMPEGIEDWKETVEVEGVRAGLAAAEVVVSGWTAGERKDLKAAWVGVAVPAQGDPT